MYSECILKCLLTDVSLLASMAVKGGWHSSGYVALYVSYMSPRCIPIVIQDTVS